MGTAVRHIREEEIPADMLDEAQQRREALLEEMSMFSEELMEAVLEGGEIDTQLIHDAVRAGTLSLEFTPVFVGSAYKNKGIQPLLDAVSAYLPCPTDVVNHALDLANDETGIRGHQRSGR